MNTFRQHFGRSRTVYKIKCAVNPKYKPCPQKVFADNQSAAV